MDVKRLIEDLLKTHSETTATDATDAQPSERLLLIGELLRAEIAEQVRKIVREELLPELTRLLGQQTGGNTGQFQIDQLRQLIREELRIELQSMPGANQPEQLAPSESEPPVVDVVSTTQAEVSFTPAHPETNPIPQNSETADITQPAVTPKMLKPMKEANLRLGIDFGTTTTAVSVRIGEEFPIPIPIGRNGIPYIPSVVYINPGSEELGKRILVGEEANGMTDETKKIRSIKRCLDCNGKSCSMAGKPENAERFPWCSGTGSVLTDEKENVPPAKIAFFIMREALIRAVQWLRDTQNIDATLENVTTVPLNLGCGARFSYRQRRILIDIASELGFKEIDFSNVVEEPILAGFSFARLATDANGYSLIYDFGGGTLDVAVVDTIRVDGKQQITVLATAAENWLGGDDIDRLVYDEFVRQAALQENMPLEQLEKELSSADKSKLRLVAKGAKELLSETELFDDSFLTETKGYLDVRLTTQEFEALLAQSGLIDKSLDAVHRALLLTLALKQASDSDLFDAGVFRTQLPEAAECIQHVVLVGGITKIPFVRKKLIGLFGSSKIVEQTVIEPISAVAIGASYPKDADHFSISAPPFGIILQYTHEISPDSKVERLPLCWPFTDYSYYPLIHAVSIAQHQVPFSIKSDGYNASITIKNVLDDSIVELITIGKLVAGDYDLFVDLEGSVSYQMKGDKPTKKFPLPLRHPAQQLIEQNKEKRYKEKNKRPETTLAEDYVKMMSEN